MKFLDTKDYPLSIHRITEVGLNLLGKEVGDWYGVNSITQVFENIFKN